MNLNPFKPSPPKKFYDSWSVFGGAFLGGPFVAIYFLAENYKNLSEYENQKRTYVIGLIITFIIFFATYGFPEIKWGYSVSLGYTIFAQGIFMTYQEKGIKQITKSDKKHSFSTGRVLGISMLGFIVTIIFGYIFNVLLHIVL